MTTQGPVPEGAMGAVRDFLKYTIDEPDEGKAKELLSAESLSVGTFALPPELKGAKYVVSAGTVEGGQVWVGVEIESQGQTLGVPFAPVEEGGGWKLDMNRTMQRMMGGLMGETMGQMAQAVGDVMKGVGEAMGGALAGVPGLADMGKAAMEGVLGGVMGPGMRPEMEKMEQRAAAQAGDDAVGPNVDAGAVEKFRAEVLAEAESEAREQMDADISLEVDFAGLLNEQTVEENRRKLEFLRDRLFRNWTYFLREVNGKIPLAGRVKGIRLEGVADASQRAAFAEGARIVYRLKLEGEGYYESEDWERILLGVVAGMAETAPPGDAGRRGASYRPGGDGARMVADYREFVEPVLLRRMGQMLGREMPVQVDWDHLAEDPETAAGMWVWGLNRVCGAIGLVTRNDDDRVAVSAGVKSVRLLTVPEAAMKECRMEGDELWIYVAPTAGEAGCFYEGEIADVISKSMKLKLRPKIAELERYCKEWEQNLLETFGVPIKIAVDFEGFSGHPDENRSLFAFALLKEHGIDALYYAVTSLAEKNPNFKQQFAQRIAWLYVESVASPEQKRVDGEQTTIRYRCYLFEGYKGYLTIKDLEKALPGVVAGMPDIDRSAEAAAGETASREEAEQEALEKMESLAAAEEGDDEGDEDDENEEDGGEEAADSSQAEEGVMEEAFARMRTEMEGVLQSYGPQLEAMLGKAMPVEIAWDSLERRLEVVGELLNASLGPVLGGLAYLGQDADLKSAIGRVVEKIVLRKAGGPTEHGFALREGVLTFSAFLSPGMPVMDPQLAAGVLKAILGLKGTRGGGEGAEEPAKKKPAAKKGPPKKKAAPAKKAAPKKGAAKKAKPAPKKKKKG